MDTLSDRTKKCEVCRQHLPLGPRPVVQLGEEAKVLIVGQAPGRRVHETGIPWNDASGKTLRKWLDVQESVFYDPACFAIVPMGFCYPGKGPSGDLPPRPECADLWHPEILENFKSAPLILLIGQYAQRYYLKSRAKASLTATVKNYREFLPLYFPLPHPSPRNQNWVKVNPWFMDEVIPQLQMEIKNHLNLT